MAKICPDCSRMHQGAQTRCPEHAAARARRDNRRRRRIAIEHGLTTAEWQRLRVARMELDDHTCQDCGGSVCGNQHLTVHLAPHLHGQHRGATIADVITLGARCHGDVTPRAHAEGGCPA